MRNIQAYRQFLTNIANYYNADPQSVLRGESFNLTVPAAALLGENIQQKSEFLKQINMLMVKDIKGYKLLGATEKGITGRKTEGRYLASLKHGETGYECVETDSGVIIPWAMFDQFARFGDQLAQLYAEFVQNQIALDMLQIGWNGTSIAENTTATDLSDVNKGWIQLLREQRAQNILTGGKTAGSIKVFGKNADFENLDTLALDLRQGLDLRHQQRNDLVFLVGADLANAESKIVAKKFGDTPTERAALGLHNLMGSFGGMPAYTPPNFPAKGAVVTTFKNLSIYTQEDSVRRRFESNEDRKGIINSYYRNEAYVVEDNGLMTAIEAANVQIGDGATQTGAAD